MIVGDANGKRWVKLSAPAARDAYTTDSEPLSSVNHRTSACVRAGESTMNHLLNQPTLRAMGPGCAPVAVTLLLMCCCTALTMQEFSRWCRALPWHWSLHAARCYTTAAGMTKFIPKVLAVSAPPGRPCCHCIRILKCGLYIVADISPACWFRRCCACASSRCTNVRTTAHRVIRMDSPGVIPGELLVKKKYLKRLSSTF